MSTSTQTHTHTHTHTHTNTRTATQVNQEFLSRYRGQILMEDSLSRAPPPPFHASPAPPPTLSLIIVRSGRQKLSCANLSIALLSDSRGRGVKIHHTKRFGTYHFVFLSFFLSLVFTVCTEGLIKHGCRSILGRVRCGKLLVGWEADETWLVNKIARQDPPPHPHSVSPTILYIYIKGSVSKFVLSFSRF